ncbi:MAG: ribosome assembly factor SBDS [Candidatus Woesearchaeota archaeon]
MFENKERVSLNLAKIKRYGKTFEVVIDPLKAVEYKEKKSSDITDVVKSREIFLDASKGTVASEQLLEEAFKTKEKDKIIALILNEGEIQLTAEQRKVMREQKLRKIITLINQSVVDPKTHLPHPVKRIEMAIEQAKLHVKETVSAEEQLDDFIKALKPILPMRFESKKLLIRIPSSGAARAYATLRSMVELKEEQWLSDGSLQAMVIIPSALEQELYDKLNKVTHGGIESEVLEYIHQ